MGTDAMQRVAMRTEMAGDYTNEVPNTVAFQPSTRTARPRSEQDSVVMTIQRHLAAYCVWSLPVLRLILEGDMCYSYSACGS